MTAILYKKRKKITQSALSKKEVWLLIYNEPEALFVEPVMGWNGSHGTNNQIKIEFPDMDSAITYAKNHGIDISDNVIKSKLQIKDFNKSYVENFK